MTADEITNEATIGGYLLRNNGRIKFFLATAGPRSKRSPRPSPETLSPLLATNPLTTLVLIIVARVVGLS